jgi:uncharacterized protein YjbJ (UPF0337 family)
MSETRGFGVLSRGMPSAPGLGRIAWAILRCEWTQPHPEGRGSMNWDSIQGNWKELKGKVRSKWAKLTDDDLENIAGKKDVLLGRLQQRYGFKRDQAERELDDFLNGIPKH